MYIRQFGSAGECDAPPEMMSSHCVWPGQQQLHVSLLYRPQLETTDVTEHVSNDNCTIRCMGLGITCVFAVLPRAGCSVVAIAQARLQSDVPTSTADKITVSLARIRIKIGIAGRGERTTLVIDAIVDV